MLEVLLTAGAEPSIRNAEGKSVIDMCPSDLRKTLNKLRTNVRLFRNFMDSPSLFILEYA